MWGMPYEGTVSAELVFQTRHGNPFNRYKVRGDVILPALRAAGLPESIRTYDLRHSHASLLIAIWEPISWRWRNAWGAVTPLSPCGSTALRLRGLRRS